MSRFNSELSVEEEYEALIVKIFEDFDKAFKTKGYYKTIHPRSLANIKKKYLPETKV